MPDFGFDGVSSSLAEFMSPDNRQHTSSAGCVLQPAGYNAIHACRPPAGEGSNTTRVR